MNWKSILATALVTGLVTVVTGMALYYFQLREPELLFSMDQSFPFQGEKETLLIQNLNLYNKGARSVDSVVATIDFDAATIRQHRLTIDPAIEYKEALKDGEYRLEITSLNPEDSVQISLLTVSPSGGPAPAKVSVRGTGVTGKPTSIDRQESKKSVLLTAVLAAYAGLVAAMMMSKRYREVVFEVASFIPILAKSGGSSIGSSQKNKIGSLFAMRGAPDEAEHYLTRGGACQYWSESDLICARALASKDESRITLHKQVLIDLIDEESGIATRSKAIIHANIARLAAAIGDSVGAQNHIREGKALDAEAVDVRVRKDDTLRNAL